MACSEELFSVTKHAGVLSSFEFKFSVIINCAATRVEVFKSGRRLTWNAAVTNKMKALRSKFAIVFKVLKSV